jgi:hypothetical protein
LANNRLTVPAAMSAEDSAKVHAAASAPPSPGEADYEAICAAVLATERGRWFLAEYARRNRQADTTEVLAAIERIAARLGSDAAGREGMPLGGNIPFERLRAELAEAADVIARTRTELVSAAADSTAHDLAFDATAGPDGAAAARCDVLAAAEELQELAWTIREQGFDSQFSDQLDRCAAICLASSRRDRGMQRVRRIRHVMRQLQGRIEAIVAMFWAGAPVVQEGVQDAVARDETPRQDDFPVLGTAPLLEAGGQATAPAWAAQIPSGAVADEGNSQGAPSGPGSLIRCSPECDEVGEGGDSPAPTDQALSVTAGSPMGIAPSAPTLTIEGRRDRFRSCRRAPPRRPTRSRRPTAPPQPPLPLEPDSTAADVRAFALDLAAEGTDGLPAAPSPISEPPATLSVDAEAKGTSPALVTAGDDDIFRTGEADLPLAAAPQLGDPPQRPVGEAEASARPSTDIAEYLLADVMALSEEERLALFT